MKTSGSYIPEGAVETPTLPKVTSPWQVQGWALGFVDTVWRDMTAGAGTAPHFSLLPQPVPSGPHCLICFLQYCVNTLISSSAMTWES